MCNRSEVVNQLKQNCFSRLSFAEKKVLVQNGRPCPDLDILTTVKIKKTTDNTSCTRHFRKELYNISDWLCGCEISNKFFCWSCLLFSTKKTVWNNQGYDDLNHLNTAVKKHTESEIHIAGYFKLKTFLSSSTARIDTSLDKQRKIDIQLHNEKAAKNREILKRLINAVCFLAKQELPFRGHNENKYSVNRGNYMELLISSQEFDPLLQEHLDTSTIFRGTSVSIQNDLINSIADVIKHEIFNEIQNTQYVAIMLDETTDISNKSQLSTVLRYFSKNESKIVERFLGFDDMSADKTAASLFNHVNQVVEKFKIENKLVAQTYDGAAVMSGHLNGLQSKVLEKYPKAIFTHCYAHVINLILQQSLECNKELKIFFRGLNSLPVFFSHSPKRLKALSEFMTKKLPTLATTRWNFTSRLVHTVHNHRTSLVDFFMFAYESGDFDNVTGMTAKGQKILDFQNQLYQERENFDTLWESFTENANELFVSNRRAKEGVLKKVVANDTMK
ncbi:zinc finger MYM-type protein 1-like [Metopolophium dirhodum]|uniref:zinc finger MYM-type protein 1-like n=1 Tax=Metopolophium dirhodum TaxID=44670 RepID=UPI0029902420|nr:zinc finger MYM-type protein 1-like [Metopolophium dirhodum]